MNKVISRRYRLFYLLIILGLFLIFGASLTWGSVPVSLHQVLRIICGSKSYSALDTIVLNIRLPRVIAALVGGASLAVAGLLLQVFFRNPVVDSFVLGISSGSGLAVGLILLAGVTFGIHNNFPLLIFGGAFCGALLVMIFVLLMAQRLRNLVVLLVVGLIFGYLCSAINSLLIAFAQKEQIQSYVNWSLGSFSGFTWEQVLVLCLLALPALMGSFLLSKPLNVLLLGEEYAQSMGLELGRTRREIVIVTSILTAVVTAYAGPVAFVGLAVPHLARMIFRTSDNRVLIPATLLLGAVVTAGCDLAARLLTAPVELPLTAMTSLFGAPMVIYLVIKGREKGWH